MSALEVFDAFVAHAETLLPSAGSTLVVAVSGGADSVALAHLLYALGRHRLVLFHLDHGLREEASADARWVEQLALDLQWSCVSQRVELRALARSRRLGLEETGREERYRRLAAVALQERAQAVVTAHHHDDHLETILMQLLRGTGADGGRGLRERRELVPGVALLRPLLGLTRAQLRGYLEAGGHAWRSDATNADLRFRRNLVRHRVLPLLSAAEPGFAQALARFAREPASVSPASASARDALRAHGVAPSRERIRRLEELSSGEDDRELHLGHQLVRRVRGALGG